MSGQVYCDSIYVIINKASKCNSKQITNSILVGGVTLLLLFTFSLITTYTFPKVFGHAFVIGTSPTSGQTLMTSPSKVEADINEPVDLRYSKISVINSNGERVDNIDLAYVDNDESKLAVTVPANLSEGTYTVSVQMLSQIDGHLTQDTFVFGIGKQGMDLSSSNIQRSGGSLLDEVSVGSAITKFPALVAQVMIVGSAFCTLWLWKPVIKIKWLDQNFLDIRRRIEYKAIILMLIGAIVLIASDFGMILSIALSVNASILDAIGTKFGNVWLGRTIVSFMILLYLLYILYNKKKKSSHVDDTRAKKYPVVDYLAIFIAGLVTLLTTSLMGHAAAESGNFLYISLDFIHNVATSLWIGGVIYLAFVVAPLLKSTLSSTNKLNKPKAQKKGQSEKIYIGDDDDYKKDKKNSPDPVILNSVLSIIIPKFSLVPVIILGTILITGPYLLYVLEDNLGLTLSSLYGKILAAKLILAGMMIMMGAYYQFIIYKKLQSRSISYSGSGLQQTHILNKSKKSYEIPLERIISKFNIGLKVEAIFGILLLGSVALLTSTGLPESEIGIQAKQISQNDVLNTNTDIPGYRTTVFLNSDNPTSSGENMNIQNINNQNNFSGFTKVSLSIEPFLPGNNNFVISFLDQDNNPMDIDTVKLKMTNIEESTTPVAVSIAPIEVVAKKDSVGIFSANSSFGFTGQWQIEVEGISDKSNMPNLFAVFYPFVKPHLGQMDFNITEFKTSFVNKSESGSEISQPLYPVYDRNRNVIWVGDTILNSGRILEFSLNDNNYSEHKISGARIITQLAIDSNNSIWYVDPLNRLLGHYDPQTRLNENYMLFDPAQSLPAGAVSPNQINTPQQSIPPLSSSNQSESQGAPSAIDVDSENNVWITIANTNIVLKFNPSAQNFTKIVLPSLDANPLGITIDEKNTAWVAEGGVGKIARIDSAGNNYTSKEYGPKQTDSDNLKNNTLKDPIFILADPSDNQIYISEHEGNAISVFDPITETFEKILLTNREALPFGMTFDRYHNLWVTEHLTNKITVIDPNTGDQKEVEIPTSNPFIQYLTTDNKGQVWAAEQRGNALARIDVNINPLSAPSVSNEVPNTSINTDVSKDIFESIKEIGFEKMVAPLIAIGLILVSVMFIRTMYVLSQSIRYVETIKRNNDI